MTLLALGSVTKTHQEGFRGYKYAEISKHTYSITFKLQLTDGQYGVCARRAMFKPFVRTSLSGFADKNAMSFSSFSLIDFFITSTSDSSFCSVLTFESIGGEIRAFTTSCTIDKGVTMRSPMTVGKVLGYM